jgi:hypothetical protein
VGGTLYIQNNTVLTRLDGLLGVTSVGGDLDIRYNDALTSLEGLENLTSVGGDLGIEDNSALCQSIVNALVAGVSVSGSVSIYGNDDSC